MVRPRTAASKEGTRKGVVYRVRKTQCLRRSSSNPGPNLLSGGKVLQRGKAAFEDDRDVRVTLVYAWVCVGRDTRALWWQTRPTFSEGLLSLTTVPLTFTMISTA